MFHPSSSSHVNSHLLMMVNAYVASLVFILAALPSITLSSAKDGQGTPTRSLYIIHVSKSAKPSHFTSHHHWYASMLDQVSQSDPNARELLYTYDNVLHGFAATLSSTEAEAMESMDGCLAVIPSSLHQLDTTLTPEFLGLSGSSGVWSQYSTNGKDIIVGVIDTGIWPESMSFSDTGLDPIPPGRWNGLCQGGRDFDPSICNNKIIGARYYFRGYEQQYHTTIDPTSESESPRDTNGHGTHVASILAGAPVKVSSPFASGMARGMAPQARLAIYKVCWKMGCSEADITAAIVDAISDGVDIISISISSDDLPFYGSNRAIATFGVIEKGVLVSSTSDNSGPFVSSVGNTAPWIMTVGASSIDRGFPAFVLLDNGATYTGTSTTAGGGGNWYGPLSLVYASATDSSKRCLSGSLDPNVVNGKIVLCDQLLFSRNPGETDAREKANEVARAGGSGMIVANEGLLGADQHITSLIVPSISVSFIDGESIKSYIYSAGNSAMAKVRILSSTVVGQQIRAPIVAAFSSRGPSTAYPYILKPDMIAPGVNIVAAVGNSYEFMSGTSMACPHVSGVAALIKTVHPTWSPAAIKSALMTSSYNLDNQGQPIGDSYTGLAADPFDMGAGHLNPQAAMDPGLVYDMGPQDYINFLCSRYTPQQIAVLTNRACPSWLTPDVNYPSFTVVFESASQSVQIKTRTVTYVGSTLNAEYQVSVKSPSGVIISVAPERLKFTGLNEKAIYSVQFKIQGTVQAGTVGFGEITWYPINGGKHNVRSPVVVAFQTSNSILSLDHSTSNTTHAFGLL